jgi:hypothetical protein
LREAFFVVGECKKIEYVFLKKTILEVLTHDGVPNWKKSPKGWLAVESTGSTPDFPLQEKKDQKGKPICFVLKFTAT